MATNNIHIGLQFAAQNTQALGPISSTNFRHTNVIHTFTTWNTFYCTAIAPPLCSFMSDPWLLLASILPPTFRAGRDLVLSYKAVELVMRQDRTREPISNLHPLICNDSVRAAWLHFSHNLTNLVDLYATQDILRPSYPPKVRRVPPITEMYPAASSCAASSSLRTRTAGTIASLFSRFAPAGVLIREQRAARTKIEPSRAGKRLRLALQVTILVAVLRDDFVENVEEIVVFREGLRCGRDGGGCAN